MSFALLLVYLSTYPLKTRRYHINVLLLLLITLLSARAVSFGQGRIVVNEFMSWSGCNTTSEFIELMNFGPGPMDIGCFIVTNGQYAVTIPVNTVLRPGEYFLLAGRDVLQKNCGNTDSIVNVDLNWTTCNCTDKPIPTTGDGFLQNGGNANEKIVLLDPQLNILDAVSRQSSISSSVAITTTTNAGSCLSKTFNLTNMNIKYESINNSTGIDNSYARRVDGDCGWVKTTAISASAPNKTGSSSSASYNFTTLTAAECAGTAGRVSITVNAPDLASLFPMTYILAFDSNKDNIFSEHDLYLFGTDSSQPSIDLSGLAYGRYRITVGSSSGCNLKSFDFLIFNCYGVMLTSSYLSLSYKGLKEGQHSFQASLNDIKNVQSVKLEGSDGGPFKEILTSPASMNLQNNIELKIPVSDHVQFRVKVIDQNNLVYYSPIVKIVLDKVRDLKIWPNPVDETLLIKLGQGFTSKKKYTIVNAAGMITSKGEISDERSLLTIRVANLPTGIYQLIVMETNQKLSRIKFVKK